MIKVIIIFILTFPLMAAEVLERLNPHTAAAAVAPLKLSQVDLKKNSQCLVCHIGTPDHKLRSDYMESCFSCHSRAPHSGMAEHTGKDLSKLGIGLTGKIECLTCHKPHEVWVEIRKKEDDKGKKETKLIYNKPLASSASSTQIERKSKYPMIRKACTDCHTPKNLH
jgi:hypothetical protein